jgi:hypothetical protein
MVIHLLQVKKKLAGGFWTILTTAPIQATLVCRTVAWTHVAVVMVRMKVMKVRRLGQRRAVKARILADHNYHATLNRYMTRTQMSVSPNKTNKVSRYAVTFATSQSREGVNYEALGS